MVIEMLLITPMATFDFTVMSRRPRSGEFSPSWQYGETLHYCLFAGFWAGIRNNGWHAGENLSLKSWFVPGMDRGISPAKLRQSRYMGRISEAYRPYNKR